MGSVPMAGLLLLLLLTSCAAAIEYAYISAKRSGLRSYTAGTNRAHVLVILMRSFFSTKYGGPTL